jgi:hypothetical protein
MISYNLILKKNLLFLEKNSELWFIDTGLSESFSTKSEIKIGDYLFPLTNNSLGLTAQALSECVGFKVEGLIGADILNNFDHIFDLNRNKMYLSKELLYMDGDAVKLKFFMGIPYVNTKIDDEVFNMFFNTGMQISFLQDMKLQNFMIKDIFEDFLPGIGKFNTKIRIVPVNIGQQNFKIKFGSLPEKVGLILLINEVKGILGNEILRDKVVGYFPRRKEMIIGMDN